MWLKFWLLHRNQNRLFYLLHRLFKKDLGVKGLSDVKQMPVDGSFNNLTLYILTSVCASLLTVLYNSNGTDKENLFNNQELCKLVISLSVKKVFFKIQCFNLVTALKKGLWSKHSWPYFKFYCGYITSGTCARSLLLNLLSFWVKDVSVYINAPLPTAPPPTHTLADEGVFFLSGKGLYPIP